ncbi:MAG TPA: FmdB family zinc ribbon protein [Acidimicrobiia bacterium]
MPTYQYRCAQCGEQFEARQSIHDDSLTVHDGCGGKLAKVLGVGGIVLKGPGFYRTDSRGKAGGGRDRKGDGESKPAAASTNGSGDSKKNDSGSASKSATASSGASKGDSSKS